MEAVKKVRVHLRQLLGVSISPRQHYREGQLSVCGASRVLCLQWSVVTSQNCR